MSHKSRLNSYTDHPNITTLIQRVAIGLALVISIPGRQASAQSEDTKFLLYSDFLTNIRTAKASDFVAQTGAKTTQVSLESKTVSTSASKVKSEAAFEEMRKAILERYSGIETVNHTFMVGNQLYDCIPVNQQPTLRKYHITKVASVPPSLGPAAKQNQELVGADAGTLLAPSAPEFDQYGNPTHCNVNMIPLLRPSLEMMTAFPTLKDFYTKHPSARQIALSKQQPTNAVLTNASFQPPVSASGNDGLTKGAYMYQTVDNLGGSTLIAVENPEVNTADGQIMSTSQVWFEAGMGDTLQTVEAGWAVDPRRLGDAKSHFFIYATSDNNQTGCFNNLCNNFIQVNAFALLGQELNPSANPDIAAVLPLTYMQVNGDWWLLSGPEPLGYFPKESFNGGPLTRHAQQITLGTEGTGSTSWPQEGNACLPTDSDCSASFQANLQYIDPSGNMVPDKLSPIATASACYDTDGPSTDEQIKGYFYVGGPGGPNCQ
ncbi:neprosin family prolyl endopeptidase [Granulicella sp. dw_53]|uniref:neprosin family prolyl endopeptidase n=1 Tax=Granulicella sp. dw_53 TaxID=2719792 RepID=UPI001BD2B267|nr:neprosin family prolyl endopeptidase [Granulicella sp. dw_53]